MENKKDRSILLIVLLVLVGLTSGYVSSTYAKYTSTIEKDSSATIAKWSFDEENSDTNLIIDFASTYDPSTLVENRIAPGTAGSFSIALTNAETETGVDYTLSFGQAQGVPTNLKFYEDNSYSNEINITSDTLTGTLEPGDATGVEIKFYWKSREIVSALIKYSIVSMICLSKLSCCLRRASNRKPSLFSLH